MSDRNVGIVRLRPEEVAKLIGLPEDHEITGMTSDWVRGRLEIRVEGPLMPLMAQGADLGSFRPVNMKQAPGMMPKIMRFDPV